MHTLETFAKHHRLRATVRPLSDSEVSGRRRYMYGNGSKHYACSIVTGRGKFRRRLRCTYSQGSAYTQPPTVVDLLDCIKLDALSYINNPTLAEFNEEYSVKDNVTFLACRKFYRSLSKLLAGDHNRDYLIYEIEGL